MVVQSLLFFLLFTFFDFLFFFKFQLKISNVFIQYKYLVFIYLNLLQLSCLIALFFQINSRHKFLFFPLYFLLLSYHLVPSFPIYPLNNNKKKTQKKAIKCFYSNTRIVHIIAPPPDENKEKKNSKIQKIQKNCFFAFLGDHINSQKTDKYRKDFKIYKNLIN